MSLPEPPANDAWNYDERSFARQPMFPWLSVGHVARAGLRVALAAQFGIFTDRREMEAALTPNRGLFDADYSDLAEVWFDYTAEALCKNGF